ncbi:hypothetical protein E1267_00080 [Nonomuraea longispora]|uniref:Uncharacterized protein n=1 Tax=Nonomuraea longispora TaxID=1848320 RepID=A0A4R4NQ38_9ACTN|nr:hypothetical protein [Nonomuraea longispora]TDC11389.1 hypothetical protein E1267_00080 [Nonomuraea longispora]
MSDVDVEQIAALLRERNGIDQQIAAIIDRPMTAGHLGEWIAARIFRIELESSATATAVDGRFTCGPLRGRSVNVKWYLRREGLLDLGVRTNPDYYLVLAGPASPAASSRGGTRPRCIESVYVFDAEQLLGELRARGVEIGVASSVRAAQWEAAEIYPGARSSLLPISPEQAALLRLFALR